MKLDEPKELRLGHGSPEESAFRSAASKLLDEPRLFLHHDNRSKMDAFWREFWALARKAGRSAVVNVIPSLPWWLLWGDEYVYSGVRDAFKDEWVAARFSWHYFLCLRTVAGSWQSFSRTLLPGPIVSGDGSRDGDIAIDMEFHKADLALLRDFGAVDAPAEGYELHPYYRYDFLKCCREKYRERDDLPKTPQLEKLNFDTAITSGPLGVLKALSEEGAADYTWALLNLDDTYQKWTLRHDGTQSWAAQKPGVRPCADP